MEGDWGRGQGNGEKRREGEVSNGDFLQFSRWENWERFLRPWKEGLGDDGIS